MACLPISCPLFSMRRQMNCCPISCFIQPENLRQQNLYVHAVSKKNASQNNLEDASNGESAGKPIKKTRAPRRSRKKTDVPDDNSAEIVGNVDKAEKDVTTTSAEDSKEVTRRGRKKASTLSSSITEEVTEKKTTKRRTRKKIDPGKNKDISGEYSDLEELASPNSHKNELEELKLNEGEDISFTYNWPPLVCCFGAAQHAFIPFGRPANRLIDHEIHESKKDMFWSPDKFVRAPGGSSSSVAIALASIGGRVEFMGKIGDDEYGHSLLYHLNANKVQTRSVVLDESRPTAVSQMKVLRRGGLRMSCVKPCAQDSFSSSEINIDSLKEAKMFYFNSSSLLDENMRTTTMQAIKASKKLCGVIFYDLNLPLPLWASSEETKRFIEEAWHSADIIEVTKQELEFLCSIKPNERFDTKDNDRSKFVHHKIEVVQPLWHENLKVLFVTNGTSKIHYYTENDNGWVHGMEDAPISPFTGDMSLSGDAIVAALMRMLTVRPDLITDKDYLEHMIKYAIDCGVIDQWLLARMLGFPPKQGADFSSDNDELGALRSITEREYRTVEEAGVEELVADGVL